VRRLRLWLLNLPGSQVVGWLVWQGDVCRDWGLTRRAAERRTGPGPGWTVERPWVRWPWWQRRFHGAR